MLLKNLHIVAQLLNMATYWNSKLIIRNTAKEIKMGKYFLGWLLGVPVFVLVIIYLINN